MATSLWCCVLFLGSVTQAFVCPAAATSTRPVLPQPHPIGLRPTVDSRKVVPTLQASPPAPPSPLNRSPAAAAAAAAAAADADADQTAVESFEILSLLPHSNVAKNFWREATKNFASKAVQQQQGEELLRVSGKLDTLSGKLDTLSGGVFAPCFASSLHRLFLGLAFSFYGPVIPMARGVVQKSTHGARLG